MAGNYPDAPSWRMATDRDGTQWFHVSPTNVITALSNANAIILNDETTSYYAPPVATGAQRLMAIFPELRDLDAYFVSMAASGFMTSWTVDVSTNTTNGLDGTWTQIATSTTPPSASVAPAYRSPVSTTQLAIRAVRFNFIMAASADLAIQAAHLYGEPAPGENPNRLALWHPTLDQRVTPAYFDWGNSPRASSADLTFRVKNLSPTLSADDIRVATEALTDGTPSVPGQHSLSVGGGAFLAQVNVGDLAPAALSSVVTLRRITPSNAQIGLFALRVFAEADAWS